MKNLLKKGLLLTLPLFVLSCENKNLTGVIVNEMYTLKYGFFSDESYKVALKLSDGSIRGFNLTGNRFELDTKYNVGDTITIKEKFLLGWEVTNN